MNWTIPSSDNYVTYYTIVSYTPSCPESSLVNETVFVAPHQSTTTYSYTLIGLYSGMNYTITVRAGNVLGESNSSLVYEDTRPSGLGILYNFRNSLLRIFVDISITYSQLMADTNKQSNMVIPCTF